MKNLMPRRTNQRQDERSQIKLWIIYTYNFQWTAVGIGPAPAPGPGSVPVSVPAPPAPGSLDQVKELRRKLADVGFTSAA